ncbi:Sec20-domain-containing protein [Syncephalastrum racemosum]|uniref:Sec20-domain-containing protein n=1 Tax=Syncephalastrum racemosum TaxID=13706 RepID=A0A1X2HG55_SYNRA|nr:Sec20-domain-containing protein [Syncephalastrum racemosum]
MSLDSQFRTLHRRAADCERHIHRLDRVDSHRLREEVASLIRTDLRSLEDDIKRTRLMAEQEDNETAKAQVLKRLSQYETQYRQMQTTSRMALWQSKQRVDDQERKMRQELFMGRSGEDFTEQFELKRRGRTHQEDRLMQASSDVTDALRRTSSLMQQELEKSSISATMLAESSKTLHSTYSEYQGFGSLMNISKRLVTQLEASDWLDRLLLMAGLAFFTLVVLYIIKKRTWDVGISWVSWLTGNGKYATRAASHAIPSASFVAQSAASSVASSVASAASAIPTEITTKVTEVIEEAVSKAATIKDEL